MYIKMDVVDFGKDTTHIVNEGIIEIELILDVLSDAVQTKFARITKSY